MQRYNIDKDIRKRNQFAFNLIRYIKTYFAIKKQRKKEDVYEIFNS